MISKNTQNIVMSFG